MTLTNTPTHRLRELHPIADAGKLNVIYDVERTLSSKSQAACRAITHVFGTVAIANIDA